MPVWKVTRCSSPKCGAAIIFLDTERGRKIPVDADGKVLALDTMYVHGRHTPHHSTCKDVGHFRRGRKR